MDPHLLRTFVAVARLGSFSAAARELGYTQSAVSQHVAALEHDLGTPLLRRRPVAPTLAGARLLDHAAPILLRLAAARADIRRLIEAPPARLALAASPLALAPPVLGALGALPGLDLTVTVTGRAAAAAAVASGAADAALVDGVAAPMDPLRLPDIAPLAAAPVAVAEDRLALALPVNHPLVGRSGVALADLVDARWIDAGEVGAPLETLRGAVGGSGFRAAVRFDGVDVAGVLGLVAAGFGLAVLPEGRARGDGVAAVRVTGPRLVHRVEYLHGGVPESPAAALAGLLPPFSPSLM